MIKVITWFRRTPGMEAAEFHDYWRQEHPKAVLRLTGLRKYVQNHVTASQYERGQPFVDGVAETWWDDRDALHAHRGTQALADLMVDEGRFIDPGFRESVLVEEVTILNEAIPLDGVKIITWVRRRPDLSIDQAQQYWRTNHAAVATKLPGLARYVQNHARPAKTEAEFMGLPMVWFASMDQVRANATSPELATIRADEPNFLALPAPFVVVDEHHII